MAGRKNGGPDDDLPGEERDPLERVFDALRDPIRRRILAALVGGGGPIDEEAIVSSVDGGSRDVRRFRIDLVHVQLPKLERMGYVEWVPGVAVRPGPRFEEVEPVVELLLEHEDALPVGL